MKIMKIFISQPMQNKAKEEIEQGNEQAIERIRERHPFNVKIGYFDNYNDKAMRFLAKSILLMLRDDFDLIVFVKGWRDDRECKIINYIAEAYEIERWYLDDDMTTSENIET